MTRHEKDVLRVKFRVTAWVYIGIIIASALVLGVMGITAEVFQSIAMVSIPSLFALAGVDYATAPKGDGDIDG